MCVHIHTKVHAHACALPSLPCPCPSGAGEPAQHPLKGPALERSDTAFLHSTDCMQHSFRKKKKKIICLLARSVIKIIFTSMTLTVSGQEAERLCRPRCFPAPLGRLPENSAAVSEERVRSLGLRLMLLAVPLAHCWEGARHVQETCLPQPYTCETDVLSKITGVLNLGREWRQSFFSLENLTLRSLVFPFLLYHCCPLNSYTHTPSLSICQNTHICFLHCGYMYMWAENHLKNLL